MFRNLNPDALGISGRQSEIIELALTYGFRGLELDVEDFVKRSKLHGVDQAIRFISSAQIRIGGLELPVAWRGDEAAYKAGLAALDEIAEFAAAAGAIIFHTTVLPASDALPYHENFELHRQRLGEIAETLGRHNVRLAVGFLAAAAHREGRQYQFICDAEALVTLLRSVGAANVGLALDTWDWHFGGGTLDQLRALDANQVVSLALADAAPDVAADTVREEQRMLPLEEGQIDNVAVLTYLHEAGYAGPVTLAPHPDCLTGMTRDGIVQKCSAVFDELWKAAGISRAGKLAPAGAEG